MSIPLLSVESDLRTVAAAVGAVAGIAPACPGSGNAAQPPGFAAGAAAGAGAGAAFVDGVAALGGEFRLSRSISAGADSTFGGGAVELANWGAGTGTGAGAAERGSGTLAEERALSRETSRDCATLVPETKRDLGS